MSPKLDFDLENDLFSHCSKTSFENALNTKLTKSKLILRRSLLFVRVFENLNRASFDQGIFLLRKANSKLVSYLLNCKIRF